MTAAEKLTIIREVFPSCTDIYEAARLNGWTYNGCGPQGSFWSSVLEELLDHIIIDVDLSYAGDWHDYACYVGGSELDRLLAAERFRILIEHAATKIPRRKICLRSKIHRVARIYYFAVAGEAGKKYWTYTDTDKETCNG